MTADYVRRQILTAIRVARFGNNAVNEFDQSFEGFYRSFIGIALGVPLFAVIVLTQHRMAAAIAAEGVTDALPSGAQFQILEWLGYAANWLALPLAMIAIARVIGAAKRYVPFVVAYNWGNVFVLGLSVIPYLVFLAGLVPVVGVALLYYPVAIFALAYHWRVARDGLQVPGVTAAGIVLFDITLSLVIAGATSRLAMAL